MRRQKGRFVSRWIGLITLATLMLIQPSVAVGSSLIYKNYIVRYDRGWDILCEPYVVKKNDWVSKIFRQKGEIAHQDYRDFIGIFKRLNPHIKNVDMIRPGQGIDIPLRKLEHGSLSGQEGGVVTIPFVALTKVTDVVKRHSETYTIQKGDTISKLIARKYGRYGSKSYNEGIKMLQSVNPQLADLDKIYAGQKLYLPDPTIRDKAWYTTMYDAEGNLREAVNRSTAPEQPTAKAVPKPNPKVPPKPKPKGKNGELADAAAYVGAQLQAKGTYYLPQAGESDFELDLSKHPTMTFDNGPKLVFTNESKIMNMDIEAFHANWPEMKPVTVNAQASTEQYVSAIFDALAENGQPSSEEVSFESQGVRVVVRAKWVRTEGQGQHLCITPIADRDQQTSDAIRRYLEQNGIVLKEILPGGTIDDKNPDGMQRHTIKNILAIAPVSQPDFVQKLAKTLGFTYVPNTSITFPYAGIQVEAFANVLATIAGLEILVDFGDLYGDAVTAIEKTGLRVVQIHSDDNYDSITQTLFSALSVKYEQHPTLLAARRPGEYNTAITIKGLLYTNKDNKQTLLTSAGLHSAVTDMLSDRGIDVVEW